MSELLERTKGHSKSLDYANELLDKFKELYIPEGKEIIRKHLIEEFNVKEGGEPLEDLGKTVSSCVKLLRRTGFFVEEALEKSLKKVADRLELAEKITRYVYEDQNSAMQGVQAYSVAKYILEERQ